MIALENKDSFIWNFDKKIIEIIHAAITTSDEIHIGLSHEGPCLESCNFYNILDIISDKFSIDKKRFVIYTSNISESHEQYKIIITDNIWPGSVRRVLSDHQVKNNNLQTIGCFVGRTNWPRLILLSWLDAYFQSQSLITCYYDNIDIGHIEGLGLTGCMINFPTEINLVANFLKTCPRINLNFKELPYQDYRILPFAEKNQIITGGLSNAYPSIFLELVCETYFTGMTFFPTEKTFRPMLHMTPFITFGPQGFLSNLQRCGFKTFGDYWDESYDNLQTKDRIIAIRTVLEKLFSLSKFELQEMYADMSSILKHNKDRLMTIQPEELKLVG